MEDATKNQFELFQDAGANRIDHGAADGNPRSDYPNGGNRSDQFDYLEARRANSAINRSRIEKLSLAFIGGVPGNPFRDTQADNTTARQRPEGCRQDAPKDGDRSREEDGSGRRTDTGEVRADLCGGGGHLCGLRLDGRSDGVDVLDPLPQPPHTIDGHAVAQRLVHRPVRWRTDSTPRDLRQVVIWKALQARALCWS